MSFYNPYQKGPAIGQGAQDMIPQIMQMMMLKQMMGNGNQPPQDPMGQQTTPPQTGLAPNTQMIPNGQMPQQPMGSGPPQTGLSPMGSTPPQGGMNPMLMQLAQNPQMMQMIMRLMQGRQ